MRKISQKSTKKILKEFAVAILWGMTLLLAACAEDVSDETEWVEPVSTKIVMLYPNDKAVSDSVDGYLSKGVVFPVHPSAKYVLSFDWDGASAELPQLQIYRIQNESFLRGVRNLEPQLRNGRLYYEFTCDESTPTRWVTALAVGNRLFTGSTKNVHLEAEGAYSDHVTMSLVLTGRLNLFRDSIDVDEFAARLLEEFRRTYTSVVIDTLFVRYAEDHPTAGREFPANNFWIENVFAETSIGKLGDWPGFASQSVVTLALIHGYSEEGMLGLSEQFGATGDATDRVVTIGESVLSGKSEYPYFVDGIIQVALHEVGHHFGLRHTTTSSDDMLQMDDASIREDGLSDTPFCLDFYKSELEIFLDYFNEPLDKRGFAMRKGNAVIYMSMDSDYAKCPDARNIMFPYVSDASVSGFTEEQLDMVRKTILLMPH